MDLQPSDANMFSNADLLNSLSSLNLGNIMPTEPKRPADSQKFLARFVKESFSDKHEVQAGETFTKSWTFRNSGEVAWPADVLFLQSTGDEIGASVDAVKCSVQPGSSYTFTVTCKAPELPGKYTAFFRLQSGNIKFGHKTWCDIMVVEPESKEPEVDIAEPAEEVKVEEAPVEDKQAEPVEPKEEVLDISESMKVLKGPKDWYMEKVGKLDSD